MLLLLSDVPIIYIYQDLGKYVVVVLLNTSWINPGEDIIHHSIHVNF